MGNTVTANGPRPRSRSGGNSAHCRHSWTKFSGAQNLLTFRSNGQKFVAVVNLKTGKTIGIEMPTAREVKPKG
jgi:hypothetical protein